MTARTRAEDRGLHDRLAAVHTAPRRQPLPQPIGTHEHQEHQARGADCVAMRPDAETSLAGNSRRNSGVNQMRL